MSTRQVVSNERDGTKERRKRRGVGGVADENRVPNLWDEKRKPEEREKKGGAKFEKRKTRKKTQEQEQLVE